MDTWLHFRIERVIYRNIPYYIQTRNDKQKVYRQKLSTMPKNHIMLQVDHVMNYYGTLDKIPVWVIRMYMRSKTEEEKKWGS